MRERPQSFPSVALAKLVQKGRKITYGIVQPGEFVADGVILVRGRDYSAGCDLPLIFHPAATGARWSFTPFGAG